jgi:hypothetical protein
VQLRHIGEQCLAQRQLHGSVRLGERFNGILPVYHACFQHKNDVLERLGWFQVRVNAAMIEADCVRKIVPRAS